MPRSRLPAQQVESFRCMGCQLLLALGPPTLPGLAPPAQALAEARRWLHAYDARLSRFRHDSELSRLNRDPREEVPASEMLRSVVAAGIWAAQHSGGLVDPTLTDAIERAGYLESRAGVAPASLVEALALAPSRRPAGADPRERWRGFAIDAARGTIRRPVGLRFDPGGVGKGLAADALAHRLAGYSRFAIDCAGDLRVGGPDTARSPYRVNVEHPLTRDAVHTLDVGSGGVATSRPGSRIWRSADGDYRHHVLDPSTRESAWTGLISATALAPTALEAETLAKAALLAGPDGARELLRVHGGLVVHDDGDVELFGSLRRPHVRLRMTA